MGGRGGQGAARSGVKDLRLVRYLRVRATIKTAGAARPSPTRMIHNYVFPP